MKSATELLEAYLNNVRTPKISASQFAEDGVLELPWVKAHAQGPAAVEKLLTGMQPLFHLLHSDHDRVSNPDRFCYGP